MRKVSAFAENVPSLTKEEKLEIFELQRLFAQAPKSAQLQAMARMNPLLESGHVAADHLMKAVREVSRDLRQAL
jgi:hypothetical protein